MSPNPKIQSKKHIARLERERRQTKIIQYVAIAVVAAVILIIGYGYLNINYLQKLQPVAEVNGEEITTREFQARVSLQRNQLLQQYVQFQQYQQLFGMDTTAQLQEIESSLNNPTIVGQEVLDDLIRTVLIRQEAAKRGISVSEEEIEAYKREQFEFFPDGTPTPTVTPAEVVVEFPTLSATQKALVTVTPIPTEGPSATPPATLTLQPTATLESATTPEPTSTITPTALPSPTATPYTLEGYQNAFATAQASLQEIGFTKEQYERVFETELLRQKLFEEVTSDLTREQEQVWARHILVSTEEEAQAVIERLNNGEEFGALAAELSIDTGSGASGGDLGWFGKGQMVPAFEQGAFGLEPGEISEPVQSEFGWHIIQVIDRATLPATESEYEQARQTAFDAFLETLREESEITIYDYWMERVPASPGLQDLQGLSQ